MNVHIATVHQGKKPFKCEICHAAFGEKSKMKKHIAHKNMANVFCSNARALSKISKGNILQKLPTYVSSHFNATR